MKRGLLVLALLSGLIPGRADASLMHFLPGPVRRVAQRATRAIGKPILVARAKTKLALDHAEMKLTEADLPRTAAALGHTRTQLSPFSPLKLSGFMTSYVNQRPAVLGGYLALDLTADVFRGVALKMLPLKLAAPALIATGLPVKVAFFVGVNYLWRRHNAEPGEKITLASTVRELRTDYADYRARDARKIERVIRLMGKTKDD